MVVGGGPRKNLHFDFFCQSRYSLVYPPFFGKTPMPCFFACGLFNLAPVVVVVLINVVDLNDRFCCFFLYTCLSCLTHMFLFGLTFLDDRWSFTKCN